MNKIHWIRDDNRLVLPRKITTYCGKEGWAESSNEFTDGDNIFDAVEGLAGVTCGRCLKSAERISNSPWGVKRRSFQDRGTFGES